MVWYCCNRGSTTNSTTTHTHQRQAAKQKKRGGTRRGIITEIPRREVCPHTPITLATMSEEASARSTAASQASQASQASAGGSSSADKGPAAADPTASGEAIDEMLAANDPPRKKQRQREYSESDFPIERCGPVGGKGSYPILSLIHI